MTDGKLQGARCLVTGGTRGLGRAVAEAFAAAGARVAITFSRYRDDADEARAAIGTLAGTDPLVFQGSVADAAHVRETVAKLVEAWGGIDVLVNAAGATQVLPVALIEEADWDRVMDVNLKGAFLFSRAVLKAMIRARRGTILNLGTFADGRVVESPVHFAAAKAGLRGLTEALAREVGRYGIRVNMLAPGLLDTGMGKLLPRSRVDEYVAKCALGRVGRAPEIAAAALFLASDASSFVSGTTVTIDGGV